MTVDAETGVGVTETFDASVVMGLCATLRRLGGAAGSLEEVAAETVTHLRDHFVDKASGASALPLVRVYVTRRSDDLDAETQDFARAAAPDAFGDRNIVCLALLATAGEEPAWNDRRTSLAHKAIPLPSVEALRRSPMIAQLVAQLGLDERHLVEPDPELFADLAERTYNVFYVAEARDSLYVPAQDGFVIPYGIRSVVGFGGVLPDGTLFAVVLFSSVPVPPAAVDGFTAVALSVKLALLAHLVGPTFDGQLPPARTEAETGRLRSALADSQLSTLSQLLDVQATVLDREARRLERRASVDDARAAELQRLQAALAASEAQRTAILEGALDCIIGMDSQGRVTSFNRAAEATFGYDRNEVIGRPLADALIPHTMRERHRRGLADHLVTGAGPLIGRRIEVNGLRSDGTEFPVELTVTELVGTTPPAFSAYLRDITARRDADRELAVSRERLAHIARTLQTSLLPSSLPAIDGLELAAAFRALGEGYEVGGDFYDVFQLADDRWAVTLGDVCGKGSNAAVITALARYTLRAAAMHDADPSAVLRSLNEAIHRQHPEQFCTAVYASIRPSDGSVEMILGGHPQPVLISADGEASLVGEPGTLLGPFNAWEGRPVHLELRPGDTLLLYSDGLTEARAGRQWYGEARLLATLRKAQGFDLRSTVRLLEADALDFAGALNDDLAVIAVRRHAF